MPQRSSWLAVQMLINQHLTDLAILAEVRRQTPKIGRKLILGVFSHSLLIMPWNMESRECASGLFQLSAGC